MNFLIAMVFLPETLDEKHRRPFEWKRANPVGTLMQMRNYPGIGWIGLVFFLMTLGHMMYPAVWAFVSNYRYGWNQQPRIIPKLGEWKTAAIGLTFTALGAFGYAFATQGWMVYAVIVAGCLEALADPPLRSLAAAKVPPSAQGELQGAMTSIFSITSIITPLLYTAIFSWFTSPTAPVVFGGAPYVLGAIFLTLAVIVFVTKVARPTPKEVERMHTQEAVTDAA